MKNNTDGTCFFFFFPSGSMENKKGGERGDLKTDDEEFASAENGRWSGRLIFVEDWNGDIIINTIKYHISDTFFCCYFSPERMMHIDILHRDRNISCVIPPGRPDEHLWWCTGFQTTRTALTKGSWAPESRDELDHLSTDAAHKWTASPRSERKHVTCARTATCTLPGCAAWLMTLINLSARTKL